MLYSIAILAFLAVVFVIQLLLQNFGIPFTQLFWFNPATALSQPWGFVTSIFLHASPLHIFFNGFALLMFGPILEQKIGSKEFLKLFFIAGIVGSVFYYLFVIAGISPSVPALGASGAIYGILGALAILTPNLLVFVWFVPMTMRYAAVLWIILEFLGTFDATSGIASAAHLGGLAVGLLYAKLVLQKRSGKEWRNGLPDDSEGWVVPKTRNY